MMPGPTSIAIWLIGSILVGVFANQRRNRDGFGWFLFSIVFSPLLGFLLVACLRENFAQPNEFGLPRFVAWAALFLFGLWALLPAIGISIPALGTG